MDLQGMVMRTGMIMLIGCLKSRLLFHLFFVMSYV